MTNVEKTAEWIKNERQALVKIANEINTIVFNLNLTPNENFKYFLEYETGLCGRDISLTVLNANDLSIVDKKEIWSLDYIFESGVSMDSTAGKIKTKVKAAKIELRDMLKMAQKYSNPNCE
jgi:hypothetical protein